MEFQKEYSVYYEFDEVTVSYGIEQGSNTILFIKSGLGGSHRGYEDRYVKMAKEMSNKYGCTVICASNLVNNINLFRYDMKNISTYAKKIGFDDYKVYFIGVSNGASQGLWTACDFPEIRRMLMVNMPLMINFHKTQKALKDLEEVEKIFVYGSRDESYKYTPFLEIQKAPKTEIITYEGVDHQFKGNDELLRALPELLFRE